MPVLSDRAPETPVLSAPPLPFVLLVDRRLAIARKGLAEARDYLAAGREEDAEFVLDKIDEDLQLLRQRLDREARPAAPRPLVRCGPADRLGEAN